MLAEILPIAVDDSFKGLDQFGVNASRATGDKHFQHTLQLSLSEVEDRVGTEKSEESVNRLDVEQCLRVREEKEGNGQRGDEEQKPLLSEALLRCDEQWFQLRLRLRHEVLHKEHLVLRRCREDVAKERQPAALGACGVGVVEDAGENGVARGERGGVFEEELEENRKVAVESAVGGEATEERIVELRLLYEGREGREQREKERLGEVVPVVEGAQRQANGERVIEVCILGGGGEEGGGGGDEEEELVPELKNEVRTERIRDMCETVCDGVIYSSDGLLR